MHIIDNKTIHIQQSSSIARMILIVKLIDSIVASTYVLFW